MSRIVVISQLPPPIHGSTIMTKTFLETIDELGHTWRLVDRRFSSSVADVGKFNAHKMASAAWMLGRLLLALLRFRPSTVVFFATNRTFSFLMDWLLSEALRWFPVRRINYLHTVGFEKLATRNVAFGWMVSRLLSSAHTTVCLGPTLDRDIIRWVDESSIVFIPNAVSGPVDVDERDPDAPPLVLYLSNLIPEKGADTFIDLAIELAPELPEATFVVAGATADQAFTDALIAKVEAAGLSGRVRFPGAITDQREKWRLLRDASLLVFPSTYPFEAFPLVLAEALASGTPIAAYRTGALVPVIESASAGAIVNIGDKTALLNAVRALLSDPASLSCFQKRSRELYECKYSLAVFQSRWRDILGDDAVTA